MRRSQGMGAGDLRLWRGAGREACTASGGGGRKGCVQTLVGGGVWGQGRHLGSWSGRWWLVALLTHLGARKRRGWERGDRPPGGQGLSRLRAVSRRL